LVVNDQSATHERDWDWEVLHSCENTFGSQADWSWVEEHLNVSERTLADGDDKYVARVKGLRVKGSEE
jgi:hypothetical protein